MVARRENKDYLRRKDKSCKCKSSKIQKNLNCKYDELKRSRKMIEETKEKEENVRRVETKGVEKIQILVRLM